VLSQEDLEFLTEADIKNRVAVPEHQQVLKAYTDAVKARTSRQDELLLHQATAATKEWF